MPSSNPTNTENHTKMQLEYLLKELELHVIAENAGRDRAEQMGQFFLTALTAIIGAVILLIQSKADSLATNIAIFLGAVVILGFGVFSFLRVCSYRDSITLVRVRLFLIRQALSEHGIRQSRLELPIDRQPVSGFSPRNIYILSAFSAFCGIAASVAVVTGIAIILQVVGRTVFNPSADYFALYGLSALSVFVMSVGLLQLVLRKYERNSAHLLEYTDSQQR